MRIGIDIGGTFTDFVLFDPETRTFQTFKRLSTPTRPERSVLAGLSEHSIGVCDIVHGSTVATNALLERKGAPTALISTAGFKDLIQIGRQNRPELYDWFADPPHPLVPDRWRLEVNERVLAAGQVLEPLDPDQVDALIPFLQDEGIQSVAICLLFSFLHPEHEQLIAGRLRSVGLNVSASYEILPEYREYERASTTVVNAYVSPIMDAYLGRLETSLAGSSLRIMQSNGGSISAREARRNAVRCILSGPAGGVIGARTVAEQAGFSRIITFDMGGTSTDVSLFRDELAVTTEAAVGGFPIRIPILDIHTVGSGGGSIAGLDAGGALRVGPESAGADPGPACYGRGHLPTVTDANLVLGRLAADHFLGGAMPLDTVRAQDAVGRLATEMELSPPVCARGIIEVANAHMARALRVISVERGYDPREFTLVSFGGAGGLHAADLARMLGIPRVLISPYASTLSALGMLIADVIKDYTQTIMLPGKTPYPVLREHVRTLIDRGIRDLVDEGVSPEAIATIPTLDMRYQGQSYELAVPFNERWIEHFHQIHQSTFGYSDAELPIEIVNTRVRVVGNLSHPDLPEFPRGKVDPASSLLDQRPVDTGQGQQLIPFYLGERLRPGNEIAGPAVIVRSDTTIYISHRDRATVNSFLDLVIEVGLSPG